jgi:hypothetical protein
VLGDKKAAGIKHQHTQICVAVNLFRAVRAEHSSPDDNRIKSDASVVHRFIPCVANVAAHDIDRECRVLDGD